MNLRVIVVRIHRCGAEDRAGAHRGLAHGAGARELGVFLQLRVRDDALLGEEPLQVYSAAWNVSVDVNTGNHILD